VVARAGGFKGQHYQISLLRAELTAVGTRRNRRIWTLVRVNSRHWQTIRLQYATPNRPSSGCESQKRFLMVRRGRTRDIEKRRASRSRNWLASVPQAGIKPGNHQPIATPSTAYWWESRAMSTRIHTETEKLAG
jgi:hypothetical protein